MFWLMVAPTVGALLAGMFNYPEYLGTHLALTFGRLRPVHVNGVIMGAFSEPVHRGMLLPGAAPVRGAGCVQSQGRRSLTKKFLA